MHRQQYHTTLLAFSVVFSIVFAINFAKHITHNWAFDAYKYLLLFAVLAEVYFSSRKLIYGGMAAIGVFLVAVVFKISHRPGANIMLILSLGGLTLIPFINALSSKNDRIVNLAIAVWILIHCTGVLFSINHWPAAGLIIIFSRLYLPILAAVLIYSLSKQRISKR